MGRPWPLLALILLAGPAGAATVLSVGDGDTIRVADGPQRLTIRLACIDAPEMAQAPYGAASREYLQELAPVGSAVTIRPQTKDRYGRTVSRPGPPRVLAYLARFMYPLRQWLPLLAIARPARRLATSPMLRSY